MFWNEGQDVALLFAGECFIGQEVRTHLKRQGHDFGDRPGEWLVHLYEEKGEGFFESLNGLFSGLLIDLHMTERIYSMTAMGSSGCTGSKQERPLTLRLRPRRCCVCFLS